MKSTIVLPFSCIFCGSLGWCKKRKWSVLRTSRTCNTNVQMEMRMSPRVLDARRMTRHCSHARWLWQKLNVPLADRQGRLAVGDCFHARAWIALASPEWKCMFPRSYPPRRRSSASDSPASQLRAIGFRGKIFSIPSNYGVISWALPSRFGNVFLDNLVTEINLLLKSRRSLI